MQEFLTYNLKVAVCLAAFYLFYKLLLSRETFHRLNRAVIIAATVVSFLLPVCRVTIYKYVQAAPAVAFTISETAVESVAEEAAFDWMMLAAAVFVAGAAVAAARTLLSVRAVVRIIGEGRHERLDDEATLVRLSREVSPFSWIRWIVAGERDLAANGEIIIAHERAHIRLHHSYDLLVTDALAVLQWFNPAMWLLRAELRAVHEYEADEAVLAGGTDARSYQMLLIEKAVGGRWCSVANSLNHSKLKNRITMMLRKKSSRMATARVLFVVPLVCVAAAAFARTVVVPVEDKVTENYSIGEIAAGKSDAKVNLRVHVTDPSGKPLSGVVMQEQGSGRNVTTDKDGRAVMQIGESSSLDLSMAGYHSTNITYSNGSYSMSGAGRMNASGSDGEMNVEITMQPESAKNANDKPQAKAAKAADGFGAYLMCDVMPTFNGGNINDFRTWVMSRIRYPQQAQEQGVQGVVIASFVVGTDGRVEDNIAILRSPDESLSAEVRRVIAKSPAWTAGTQEGKPVRVKFTAPIQFSLPDAGDTDAADSDVKGSMEKIRVVGYGAPKKTDEASDKKMVVQYKKTDEASDKKIVVRYEGNVSYTNAKSALWIVDGREVTEEDAKAISSDGIESVTVLKGASAAAEYGERGREGVIIIKTKKAGEKSDPTTLHSVVTNGDKPAEYYIDGKKVTKEELAALPSERIANMNVDKSDDKVRIDITTKKN